MSKAIEIRYWAALDIIQEAGRLALDYFHAAELEVESKGLQDRVSIADREVEQLLRAALSKAFPDDGFIGEELGTVATGAEFVWVVDPIDGTDCFVHRIPAWSISIGLLHRGKPTAGCVLHPPSADCFHARQGGGAWCNDVPIQVSNATRLTEGLVAIGFSYRADPAITLQVLQCLFAKQGIFQRNGSAALSLAYVASGRYLAFLEAHINAWDVLGGLVLVREAGGWHSPFFQNDFLRYGNPLIAAAPGLRPDLEEIFQTLPAK